MLYVVWLGEDSDDELFSSFNHGEAVRVAKRMVREKLHNADYWGVVVSGHSINRFSGERGYDCVDVYNDIPVDNERDPWDSMSDGERYEHTRADQDSEMLEMYRNEY
jgi:hypothetical protein